MDYLSHRDPSTFLIKVDSKVGNLLREGVQSNLSIFPENYLKQSRNFSQKPFYPVIEKDKKNPLEIPYQQKIAFAMAILSLASFCLGRKNASMISSASLACHVGLSLVNFAQNPSLTTGMPIGMMGLQTAISFTPMQPILPYWNLLLQGRSTYSMGKDVWNQVGVSLQHLTKDNYLTVGRNLFVYGVNALNSGYHLYQGYQNTCVQKNLTSEPSENDIQKAKELLCQERTECPTEWTPKEIKRLYRKQSLSSHPDKTGSNEAFKALTEARDLLLSVFKASSSPKETRPSAHPKTQEPIVEEAPSFGLQQIQETISSWRDSFWGFLKAFDKYMSFPVADATNTERIISAGPVVLSDRALGHVLGDPYIQGTNLEGWNMQDSTQTLIDLSEDLSHDLRNKIIDLKDRIVHMPRDGNMNPKSIRELANHIALKVMTLQPGEDIWMEGGYLIKDADGHAMLYQWVKREDGDYDIYIYNTGDGLKYHYQEPKIEALTPTQSKDLSIVEATSQKRYVSPIVKFSRVPGSAIGLIDEKNFGSDFFKNLISLTQQSTSEDPVREIYLEIFGTLNEYRVVDAGKHDLLIKPQTSGTCSWYVLIFAALRKYLQRDDIPEKIQFQIENKAFEAACALKQGLTSNPTRRELCIRGGYKLLADLATLHENGITHQEGEQYREQIQASLDELSKTETSSPSLHSLPFLGYQGKMKLYPSEVNDWVNFNEPTKTTNKQTTPLSSSFLDVNKIENLLTESEKILQFSTNNPPDLTIAIEKLVKRLPSPSQLERSWEKATSDQIRKSIELLYSVLSVYAMEILPREGRLLTEQNTAWALLATIHQLSSRLNKDLKYKYGIFFTPFKELINDWSFTNFRHEDLKLYQEIVSYFEKLPKESILFNIAKALEKIDESNQEKKNADEELLEKIASQYSQVSELLQKKISEQHTPSIPNWMVKRKILRESDDIFTIHPSAAYISFLRKASYLANVFTNPNYNENPNSYKLNSIESKINTQNKEITFSSNWVDAAGELSSQFLLMPKSNGILNFYFSSNCLLRTKYKRENSVFADLSSNFNKYKKFQDPILDSTLCQPTLQNSLLIHHFYDNIGSLSDIDMQNIFLLNLFKSYSEGTPIHEDIKNPHFVTSVSEFLEKGLSKFFYKRDRPDVKTTLFFFEIARRLAELDPKINLRKFSSDFNKLLDIADLTEEEKRLLHMHRILQYTTQKEHLCGLSKEETEQNVALREIFVSWMHVSSHKFEDWHHFHSQSEMVHFIHDLSPVFEKLSPEFLHAAISDLFPTHTKPFSDVSQDDPQLALYQARDTDGEIWSINPVHGRILRRGEETQFGMQKDFSQFENYKRLFGDQKFSLSKEGETFVFTDSHKNTFRIFEKNLGKDLIIQLYFEGQWHEYMSTNNPIFLNKMPKALIADHFVFRSKEKTLFVHKKTFSIDFVNFEGISQGKTSILHEDVHLHPFIESFEDTSWILEQKHSDQTFTIQMPRFVSLTGKPLEFTKISNQLSWNDNPQFTLRNGPKGLLGLCSNYLLVQDGEKSKLLVPLKPVEPSKEFAPHCTLDIQDKTRENEYKKNEQLGPYTGELNSPQEGKYSFIEYDIENNSATPLNPEGALFLSYLTLAQKDYAKALSILQQDLNLKTHFPVSINAKKILNLIINHPISSYDRSANAVAFALKAFLLFPKKEQEELSATRNTLWSRYEQGLDRVEANLRLSKKECKQILSKKVNEQIHVVNKNDPWYWSIKTDQTGSINDMQNSYYKMFTELTTGYSKLKRFAEVYNKLLQAKTPEEKIFIKQTHLDFFKQDCLYPPALQAVLQNDELNYLPCPTQKVEPEEARKWLEQFDHREDLVLVQYRSLGTSFADENVQPLAQSLHKVKAINPAASFSLSSVQLSENGFTKNLMDRFFVEKEGLMRQSFLDEKRLISQPIPELYQTAVQKERSDFVEEYKKGLMKNQKEKQYALHRNVTIEQIHETLRERLQNLNIQQKKVDILKRVNRLPDHERKKTLTLMLEGAKAKSKVKMHEIVNIFLEGQSKGYSTLNSHLTAEEIQEIDNLVKEFLIDSIESNYLEKALQITDPQELGTFLSADIAYTSSEYDSLKRQFLVYEYRSGLRMRKEQVSLILKMTQERNCVTQLMMGGGKTSVVASNLLYWASKPGRIAFFIPPAAQLSTLKENLGNMQKKHFHQEVVPIQMKRSQLDIQNLKWIQEQFAAAKSSRNVILTTRETVESIVLEYLDFLGKGDASDEKLQLLSFLVKDIKESGDVLVDEVDLILNPMQETNFPFGIKEVIDPSLINMTRHLFTLLASPKFEKKIRLRTNEQALLNADEHRKILLEIMTEFFDEHKELDLAPSEKQAFLEFISGQESGRSFTQFLEFKSQKTKLKSSVEQISLLKHLSSDILPLTLSKSTGENYGRVLEDVTVGPYHGVNSPSFTEFGSQWEAMSYHFQTALSRGITSKQVEDMYQNFFKSAGLTAEVHGTSLESTWEAKTFKEITGYTFQEYPNHLKEAVAKVNQNPKLQLLIEASSIAQLVGYYTKYFRSTSQNFAASFSGFDSFSGTPWNPESFPKNLEENFYPDMGTEGKIIDVFLQRAQEKSLQIHTTNSIHPKETLAHVLDNMSLDRKRRVLGFIDSAGLFKESSGVSIAQEILHFYEKNEDDRIQAVLFFDRPDPLSPMVLMALKKGSKEPIIIGGTQAKEIAKHGLSLKSTFVYYDQTHCEATDILQKDDAINLISVNHRMIRRTLTQGILRLRSYFKGQDVEVVIPQGEVSHFTHTGNLPTHQDILLKVVDNQAIRKADQTFRSYRQKIDHALREIVMEKLRNAKNLEEEIKSFQLYQDVLITTKDQDLYSQFGSPEIIIDSLQALIDYAEQKKVFFQALSKADSTMYQKAEVLLSQIIDSAKASLYRPSQVKKVLREDAGTEMELELEEEQETETDHSMSLEIENELDSYQTGGSENIYYEEPWTTEEISRGFNKGIYGDPSKKSHPRLYGLQDVLSDKTYVPYQTNFSPLFSDNFFISSNFLRVHEGKNYIFSKKSKAARQILIVKENDLLKSILISTEEAAFFKDYIKNNRPKNMWLLLPDGKPFIGVAPEMTPDLKDLLWQANLYNGNVEALLRNELTPQKRKKLNAQLLHKFLAFKIKNEQQKILLNSHFSVENSVKKKEKDLLSFFRNIPDFQPVKEELDDYEALVKLGITKETLGTINADVREILLHHIEDVSKLKTHKIDLLQILKLRAGDLIKVLENVDSLIVFLQKGASLSTFIKIATSPKKPKASVA